jgi:hypothetical protein
MVALHENDVFVYEEKVAWRKGPVGSSLKSEDNVR